MFTIRVLDWSKFSFPLDREYTELALLNVRKESMNEQLKLPAIFARWNNCRASLHIVVTDLLVGLMIECVLLRFLSHGQI